MKLRVPPLQALLILCLLAVAIFFGTYRKSAPPAAPTAQAKPHSRPASALAAWARWTSQPFAPAMASDPSMLREGITLARRRLKELQDLARTRPAEARARLMTLTELAALPEEIRRECEQPWSAMGALDLRWSTTELADGTLKCQHHHYVDAGGLVAEAFGPHLLDATAALGGVFLQGHRLGDAVLLDPTPARTLTAEEAAAARQWFPDGNATDPISGNPAPTGLAAVIGGKIHRFENEDHLRSLEDSLATREKSARSNRLRAIDNPFASLAADADGAGGGINQATPFMTDALKVLFIRVDFSDFPGEANSISRAALETTLSTVATHINQYSYGVASLTSTVTPTLYRMPATGASYAVSPSGNSQIITAARSLAAANFTLSNYDVVAVYFPSLSGVSGTQINYGGLASVGGGNHWINGANSVSVILHEFGHNFGLFHSNYWNPSGTLGGARYDPSLASVEYGDIFDRMGSGAPADGYFSPYSTHRLGWMPPGKVVTPTGNGTWRIHRFDTPGATSNPNLAIRVPMGNGVFYWVGHRKRFGAPFNLSNGAYVVAEGLYDQRPNLIDMTPGSNASAVLDRDDCGLPVNAFRYDSAAGVRFATVASGGTAPNEWIDVNIQFDARIQLAETVMEVDEAAGMARVTLQRSFGGTSAASVNYTTASGTATSGIDFLPVSGTVQWAAGDNSDKIISIPIRPDTLNENDETFTFTLSSPSGAVVPPGGGTATFYILDPGSRFQFFDPGFFNTSVNAVVPLPDGKVIIGGNIASGISGSPDIRHIARLNPDGSVDSSFLTGVGFNNVVTSMVLQPDGKLVVAGDFTSYDGTPCNRIIRLNANGTADTAFLAATGTGPNSLISALAIEASGKIIAAGDFSAWNGQPSRNLVRLLTTGARDSGTPLSMDATIDVSDIYSLLPLSDGRIFAAGILNVMNYAPAPVDGFRGGVALLTSSGSRDPSFEPGAGAHLASSRNSLSFVRCMARQPDGKILIGGGFTAWNGTPVSRLARINMNGTIDTTFTPPAISNTVRAITVQPSGRVIMGGFFTTPSNYLTRLTSTGSVDSTWFPQGTPSFSVFAIAPAADGTVFIGGNFFQYAGVSTRPIVRIAGGGGDAYSRWMVTRFTAAQVNAGLSGPYADPDGDGLNNLLEMAIGSSPTAAGATPNAAGIQRRVNVGGLIYMEIEFPKGPEADSLWITGQFSNQLTGWTPATPSTGSNATYSVVEDSPSRLILRDNTPVSSNARRFGRFQIRRPQ